MKLAIVGKKVFFEVVALIITVPNAVPAALAAVFNCDYSPSLWRCSHKTSSYALRLKK
jgi:hypothetical protein